MARMTVARLIEILSDMDENAEVRLAHQPHYPFEYSVAQVVEAVVETEKAPDGQAIVYIGEGRQIGYLPGEAREELGWSRG